MTTEKKVWTGKGDTIQEFTLWLGKNCTGAQSTSSANSEFVLLIGNDNAIMRVEPGVEVRVHDHGPVLGRFLSAGPFSCKMEPAS